MWHRTSLGHVLFCVCALSTLGLPVDQLTSYTIVVDAGSSGSRFYVYEHILSEVKEIADFTTEPGLSHYASTPDLAGPSLNVLIEKATESIPAAEHASTRLWIKATGGIRSVEVGQRKILIAKVEEYMRKSENSPFDFQGFDTLSGEEEAAFAWLAVNDLTKSPSNDSTPTAGILEMGGSSMQIAFKPDSDIFAAKFPLYVNSKRTALFAHSFPQFGINDLMRRAMRAVVPAEHDASEPIDFACFNEEYSETREINNESYTFIGTGNATICSSIVTGLMGLDIECLLPGCGLRGRHIADIPVDKKFYGLSMFFFVTNDLGLVGWNEAKVVTPKAILEETQRLCNMTKSEAQAAYTTSWEFLKNTCMAGHFLNQVFTAVGFEEDSTNIVFARKINGQSASWTLGADIYETDSMPQVREPCTIDHMPSPAPPGDGNERGGDGLPGWTWMLIGAAIVALMVGAAHLFSSRELLASPRSNEVEGGVPMNSSV